MAANKYDEIRTWFFSWLIASISVLVFFVHNFFYPGTFLGQLADSGDLFLIATVMATDVLFQIHSDNDLMWLFKFCLVSLIVVSMAFYLAMHMIHIDASITNENAQKINNTAKKIMLLSFVCFLYSGAVGVIYFRYLMKSAALVNPVAKLTKND